MASTPSVSASRTAPGNRPFANRVVGFVNRVRALPGFPVLPVAGLCAGAVMTLVGGFGTLAMPLPVRAGFWLLLMAWNVAKWQAWFAWRVRRPEDWARAALLGVVPINLPLPLEIGLALRVFGITQWPIPWRVWPEALAISAVVLGLIALIVRRQSSRDAVAAPASPPGDGLLSRAGLRTSGDLLAIEAEDHYCRVHLAGGRSVLVLYRFGDALAEVAGLDGAQVHRGAWVADHAVAGATREGRRWKLALVDGGRVAVSASHAPVVRARGWLRRSGVALAGPAG